MSKQYKKSALCADYCHNCSGGANEHCIYGPCGECRKRYTYFPGHTSVTEPHENSATEPVQEQIAPTVQEQTAPTVQEQIAPTVQEQTAPTVQEQTAPTVQEQIAPTVQEQTAPTMQEQTEPTVQEQATPLYAQGKSACREHNTCEEAAAEEINEPAKATVGECRLEEAEKQVRLLNPEIELSYKETQLTEGLFGRGLFYYKKWWERTRVDVVVNGDRLSGIPIFTDKNTLRVVNDDYSYFIPLEKVDYIRTTDGLKAVSNNGL